MINLTNVSKTYGNSGKKAVDSLNWDIEDGKITGFIGPNGAGKIVSDSPDNFLRLKGIEYLNFMADIYEVPSQTRSSLIDTFAKRFDMEEALGSRIMGYSHGMRQKIMVMGALIHNPSIWILDEPLTGLDPNSAFVLKEMMREHASTGKSVLFSTHVLEVAEKLCDQVAIINKGKLLFLGTLDQLKTIHPQEDSLENIFLEITKNA